MNLTAFLYLVLSKIPLVNKLTLNMQLLVAALLTILLIYKFMPKRSLQHGGALGPFVYNAPLTSDYNENVTGYNIGNIGNVSEWALNTSL